MEFFFLQILGKESKGNKNTNAIFDPPPAQEMIPWTILYANNFLLLIQSKFKINIVDQALEKYDDVILLLSNYKESRDQVNKIIADEAKVGKIIIPKKIDSPLFFQYSK